MTGAEWAAFGAALLGFAALWITRERRENRRRDFRRTGLDKTLLAAVLMTGAAFGQEWQPPKPGLLCGQRIATPETNSIAIACPDFDALAKLGVPGVYGQRLQVLIQAKYGEAVRVRAYYTDAEGKEAYTTEWADITRNQAGELGALVQFLGWQFTRVEVKVFRE